MEKTLVEKCETFYDEEEALDCQAQHPGAEITAERGYPVMLFGQMMYPYPEARPTWTVWWDEEV